MTSPDPRQEEPPAPTEASEVVYGPQTAPELLEPVADIRIDKYIGDEQRTPASSRRRKN
jgi:hypothetical protein